jgi:hypothetical protein
MVTAEEWAALLGTVVMTREEATNLRYRPGFRSYVMLPIEDGMTLVDMQQQITEVASFW